MLKYFTLLTGYDIEVDFIKETNKIVVNRKTTSVDKFNDLK